MIVLPWPDHTLSPNARPHHFALARAKKAAKTAAYYLTREAVGKAAFAAPLPVKITFNPPSNHRRDDDNMIASFKAARDGIAKAIGVDDADWIVTYEHGPVVKGGRVVVELGAVTIPFRGVIS